MEYNIFMINENHISSAEVSSVSKLQELEVRLSAARVNLADAVKESKLVETPALKELIKRLESEISSIESMDIRKAA